jgi:hypothetical protein
MIKLGAWASCAMLFLGCAGCSWIPWLGKKETCDLSKYRVPAVVSADLTGLGMSRGDGPAVEVELPEFDFGKVSGDSLLTHDFKLRNTGKSVLKVKKVLPS